LRLFWRRTPDWTLPRPTWFDLEMTGGKIENSTQLSIVRQKATQVLDKLIDRSSQVVLLDFPNHGNIGDSLIWLGTLEYLKLRRVRIVHAADFGTYRTGEVRKHVGAGATVLFHGGGNFGDLWPMYHSGRLRLIEELPSARVIVLPQTIYYQDDRKLEADALVFASAAEFHLLVRDTDSLAAARRCDPGATACPDMVHFLTPPAVEATKDIVYLLRLDKERVGDGPLPAEALDWPGDDERPAYVHTTQWFVRKQRRIPETLRDIGTPTLFAQLAAERLRRGAPLIGAARVVVTDRLHAALLGLLMGRAVVALDNFYGKLRRYSAAWFPGMPGLYFAEDFDSARRLAQEIVREARWQ
jgi:exopolysaccharide biosynthesis predicted pyruvyltransferase EpsI